MTVHRITLVTIVVRGGGRGESYGGNGNDDAMAQPNTCVTIINLVLEKVLTVHANARKGSMTKI